MSNKEQLNNVFRGFQAAKEQKDKELEEKLRKERLKKEDRLKKEAETVGRLRRTGIIDLLESVRDSGLVKSEKDVPAELNIGPVTKLKFEYGVKDRYGDRDYKYIEVFIEENKLVVKGNKRYEVKDVSLMGNIIGQALSDPAFFYSRFD